MDEIDNGEIARFLSGLSSRTQLPEHVQAKPPSEFSANEVGFDDNSWLARVAEVQGWLRLDDPLSIDDPEPVMATKLFNQLVPDTEELLFNVANGLVRMTEHGVEALERRLALADERSARFVEALEEGGTRNSASTDWEEEWDEPEAVEPPNIKATVDTLPIVEFVGHARENELDLNPPYQREYIWSNPNSQKLIESILRGIPLPSIILATVADDDKLQIVDGKQRLTSILRFVGAHPSAVTFAKERNDLELFQSNFRKFAKKHALTPDDVRKHYLPFKTRNYDKTDPLRPLSGKFYDEIKEVQTPIGGKQVAVRRLFDSSSSPYRIPILRYEDTAVRDIHQVFRIYNQQGVKLNAEEIRNAVYNHLKIVQLMLFIGGDRADPNMADYAVEAGVDPSFAYTVIADMGFSIARFRRTKVLLWMLATLLHPTGSKGSYRTPSTASHIDSFLEAIDKRLPRLRATQVLTALARDLVAAIELHAEADRAWHPRFRSKRDSGTKWEELGAVASLAACFVLVMLGKQDRLIAEADAIRAVTKEKKGPGPGSRRYIIARRSVDRTRLLEAVEASIAKEPQLARWRDWQGEPKVAVAVSLSSSDVEGGRVYNFLPMAAEVPSRIRGHVDAPFYASIDRRRANFELPLNSFLLDELAETALRAATELKPISAEIGRNAVFDLAAWLPDDVIRLNRASQRVGIDWRDCAVVPAAGGSDSWSTFRAAYIWHEQGYKLLRVRRLVKAGIKDLADPLLESQRLDRLHKLLDAVNIRSLPDECELADWIEAVANSLDLDGSALRTWSTLYEECRKALPTVNALRELGGKAILKTRDGAVHSAMSFESISPVFVRDAAAGTRERDRAPLPPSAVASKFAILDDGIALGAEVVSDFLKAGLVRRYDALQVLKSVPSTFGEKPAPKRREAALKWAFDVWRAEGQKSEKVLKAADLHVETRGGWRPASSARFSEGWTAEGRKLSTYLSETASLSPDCARAADLLLLSEPAWASKSDGGRKQWTDFLRAAGVRDGLPLLADDDAPTGGTPIYTWNAFRSTPVSGAGRTPAWVAAHSKANLPNPFTSYSRRGELWRIPGQVEHTDLPPEARHRLAELILIQLAHEDQHWLRWRLGRYERWGADQNENEFQTPAATFIAAERWMPVEGDPDRFERPDKLWSSTDRKQRPPRYVDRPRERLADMVEDEKHLTSAMFAKPIGLRDWSRSDEAVGKLAALARGATGLEPRERVAFRKAYQNVWIEVCSSEISLPANLPVAVVTTVGPSTVTGNPDGKTRIFVTGDPLQAETRAVIAAGQSVLELVDEDQVEPAIERLRASGGFEALRIDPQQVGVLVDGEPMVATVSNPLLASDGLDWLPEAAVLANEVLGQALERQISSTLVDQRLRRVRVLQCGMIRLSVGGTAVEEALPFYALPDDEHPTLVIGEGQEISWSVLAEAAPALSTLLDRRMRSLETLLLRLAARRVSPEPRQRPSDEELARALGCKVELVREHTLALRTDGALLLARLLPVVACITDLETAELIRAQLGETTLRSQVIAALATIEERLPLAPAELLDEIARPDFAEVRRTLGLDYGRLNQMLAALAQPILSNEGELRRLFEVWKGELAAPAVDRLRRRYWLDFEEGRPLDQYVALRNLDFLEFQPRWILDRENLEKEEVRALLDEHMDELLGNDVERKLEPVHQVRNSSKRTLQRFIDAGTPVIGAWCFRNERADPWAEGAVAVLKRVDQLGLLDFAPVEAGREIEILERADRWPAQMPHTVDPKSLGLDPKDLDGEKERERERREKAEASRRTIRFADTPLDTRAKGFAQSLVELANEQMIDGGWLTRSRRKFSLAEQTQSDPRRGGRGGKGNKRRRKERLNEDVKSAMGFASEYLASRFLMEKHKGRFNDRCWVSENRSFLEIDWEGDDALGFDFKIQTVEVEWRYEVKSNLDDAFEFEFTQNEMRNAAECAADTTKRYRILYVPFVFDPTRWRVMELPNPMSTKGRSLFKEIGAGATRLRFETI